MKKYFLITLIFSLFLFVFSFKISLAQILCGAPNNPSCGFYETCPTTMCTPNPGICAKNVACPACGYPATGCCGSSTPAWTKWNPICVKYSGLVCQWAWSYTDKICSTGDKCIVGETGLRAGFCDCSYGGTYKYCCDSSGNPEGCVREPESMQDSTDPPAEGECPGGLRYLVDGDRVRSSPCSGPTSTPVPGVTAVPTSVVPTQYIPPPNPAWIAIFVDSQYHTVGDQVNIQVCQKPNCCWESAFYYPYIPVNVNSGPRGGTVCTVGNYQLEQPDCNSCSTMGNSVNSGLDKNCVWNTTGWPAGVYDLGVYTSGHGGQEYCNDGAASHSVWVQLTAPTPIPTPTLYPICGYIKDSTGAGINGVLVRILNGGGGYQDRTTDATGKFTATSGFISSGDYAVRPQSVPFGFVAPAKTTTSGWTWNYCVNPNPGTQPWADTPTGSPSYECQRYGSGIDCASQGGSTYCRCNFTYDNQPITCTASVNGSQNAIVNKGVPFTAGLYSVGNSSVAELTRLYLEKTDKNLPPLDPVPAGTTYTPYSGIPYYNIFSTTTTANGISLSKSLGTDLPAGKYYLHCDLPNHPDLIKCSGNPFCNPPVGVTNQIDCSSWVSCSNTDRASLCVQGSPTAPTCNDLTDVFNPSTGSVTLQWTAPSDWGYSCPTDGPISFNLHYGTTLPGTSTNLSSGTLIQPINGLSEGTYLWRVDAVNNLQVTQGPTCSFSVQSPQAWFQTQDGDIHANGSITSLIPGSCAAAPYLSVTLAGGSPGVVSWAGSDPTLGTGSISVLGWQAKTGIISTQINYEYLINRLNVDTTKVVENCVSGTCPLPTESGTYYLGTDAILAGGVIGVGKKVIIFAEGNINISSNITVPSDGFFALIAKEGITFSKDVRNAQGFFLSDSTITIASDGGTNTDLDFQGEGSFIGLGEVVFERGLVNNCTPAESFSSRPDLFINAPPEFQYSSFLFQEVAP